MHFRTFGTNNVDGANDGDTMIINKWNDKTTWVLDRLLDGRWTVIIVSSCGWLVLPLLTDVVDDDDDDDRQS